VIIEQLLKVGPRVQKEIRPGRRTQRELFAASWEISGNRKGTKLKQNELVNESKSHLFLQLRVSREIEENATDRIPLRP